MKIILPNVRLAFPSLFEASSYEGGPAKYSAKFIIDPADKALVAKLDKAMFETAREKWGAKAEAIFERFTKTGDPKAVQVPFIKEPKYNRDGEPFDGFEGMFYCNASNKARPTIIDRDKTPLIAADGRPYAGCYVNASLELWAQDNTHGRAIRAELKGVQFVRDGDSFGGGSAGSPDDFEDLSDGADAEDELV